MKEREAFSSYVVAYVVHDWLRPVTDIFLVRLTDSDDDMRDEIEDFAIEIPFHRNHKYQTATWVGIKFLHQWIS